MEEVIRECTARRCFRVLIEERLEGPRLGTSVNRGFPVKVFPTVAAAEEWLLSIPDAGTQNPHR
jgi:hypothetical protein